jgi:hypothetical protein
MVGGGTVQYRTVQARYTYMTFFLLRGIEEAIWWVWIDGGGLEGSRLERSHTYGRSVGR